MDCLRAATRTASTGGIIHAHLPDFGSRDANELANRLPLRTLLFDGPDRDGLSEVLWERRELNWRESLAALASISTIRIHRITNAWRALPVVHSRGRFAAIAIWLEGLPDDADLFDVDIRIGGANAKPIAIGPAGARGIRKIVAQLPELEQTGLLPVSLLWMGERMGSRERSSRTCPRLRARKSSQPKQTK